MTTMILVTMERLKDGNVELCRLIVVINKFNTRVNIYVRK